MSPRFRSTLQAYLPDLVYGANDGIVTTVVIIAAVSGASISPVVILVLGAANLVADGFSMGTSNLLAARSTVTAATRPHLLAASRRGMATFLAFVAAGALPLAPYAMPLPLDRQFPIACTLAGLALFLAGSCRAAFSDRGWLVAGLEMFSLGAIASLFAYAIGAGASYLVGWDGS